MIQPVFPFQSVDGICFLYQNLPVSHQFHNGKYWEGSRNSRATGTVIYHKNWTATPPMDEEAGPFWIEIRQHLHWDI